MKRWPVLASFILFLALCATLAYWGMQLFKPPLRPVAAPPQAAAPEVRPESASSLFGGRAAKAAVASNYQLRGVIMSGSPRDSVAIISADGKPPQAVRAGREISPGVTVKEVHRDYVLVAENGAPKRVELPESAKAQLNVATTSPTPARPIGPGPTPPAQSTQPPPPPNVSMPAPQTTVVNPPSAGTLNSTPPQPPTPNMPQADTSGASAAGAGQSGAAPAAQAPQGRGLFATPNTNAASPGNPAAPAAGQPGAVPGVPGTSQPGSAQP
ncbi:type II secretion system protein C (GspC) [Noviherbaspirillum humi]|uniref:Type II secretion system protein C (GspC) n=1 Tax=Noviherbaspirillum humi TaxID=1688639 RepID=A0A239CE01_9BURK|nr:type II secretion system protein N [Noviherbaspirillum humi]SNS18486.1 type II secretion system protein C (GspC) [Noviherbaspirillum humi]